MRVRVTAPGVVPTGTVTLTHGSTVLGTATLAPTGVVNVVLIGEHPACVADAVHGHYRVRR